MEILKLLSPSKINFTLNITGKRGDGYHYINSIFQPINLFDEIEINIDEGDSIKLKTLGIEIPENEENIVLKASKLYLEKSSIKKNISIKLKKNIPIGAGLGGGSGNAAAILVGLNKLLNKFNGEELMELALSLGSDVPFFIRSVTSLVEGVGDKLTLLNGFPLFHYVLLYPKVSISTKDVYGRCNIDGEYNNINNIEILIEKFKNDELLPLNNDLEIPALQLYPGIKKYKEIMKSMGAKNVVMTGSGSTFISVFRERKEAEELFDYLSVSDEFDLFIAEGIKGWHYLVE